MSFVSSIAVTLGFITSEVFSVFRIDQLLVIQIFFHSCENADTLKLIDLVRLSQSSLLLLP